MGNNPNGLIVSQACHVAAVEEREDAALELDGGVARLIKNAPQVMVALGRARAGVDSRGLIFARAGPYPGRQVLWGKERGQPARPRRR